MDNELISALEGRIEVLLQSYSSLKSENARLVEEIATLRSNRETVKARVDTLIKKLECF